MPLASLGPLVWKVPVPSDLGLGPPRPTTLNQWRVTCVSQIILSSSRCSKCHLRGRRAVWVLTWNMKACLSPRCCCCSYSVVWGPQSLVSFLASHSPQCASEASGPWWDWNFQTPRISVEDSLLCHGVGHGPDQTEKSCMWLTAVRKPQEEAVRMAVLSHAHSPHCVPLFRHLDLPWWLGSNKG